MLLTITNVFGMLHSMLTNAPTLSPLADVPQKEPERWNWIVFQLKNRGLSLSEVARLAGRSRTWAMAASSRRSPDVELAIAEHLGTKPEVIWPERYNSDGSPIRLAHWVRRADAARRKKRATRKTGSASRAAGGSR